MKNKIIITLLFLTFCNLKSYSSDEIKKFVNSIGLSRCNKAIDENFRVFNNMDQTKKGNWRFDVFHSKDNPLFFSIMLTAGKSGDTVFQKVDFNFNDKKCFAYSLVQINSHNSCLNLIDKLKSWNIEGVHEDFIWTKNNFGAFGLFQSLPSGGCNQVFKSSSTYDVS